MKFLAILLLTLTSGSTLTFAAVIPPNGLPYSPSYNKSPSPNPSYDNSRPTFRNPFPDAPVVPNSYLITLRQTTQAESHLDNLAKVIGKPRKDIIQGENEGEEGDLSASASYENQGNKVQAQFKEGKVFSYVASLEDDTLEKLKEDGDIEIIEPNYLCHATVTKTQTGAPWGLARMSNTGRVTLDDRSIYQFDDSKTGQVKVFVIDSGINIDHEEFQGRAKNSANFITGEGYTDLFGHGTHVAGTIGGKTFGVAKEALIFNVKVLGADGTGSNAGVIAGINHVTNIAKKWPTARYVINMSIGGPQSVAEENALKAAVAQGIHVVVAAGNEDRDACTTSPGSSSKDGVIVVGATTSKDTFATFSNWGSCVSILAPGVDILSAWNTGKTSTQSIQGTSMASPHVAGLVAYWYARDAKLADPKVMKDRVMHYARTGKISGLKGSTPNKMVWNGY